jgi:hypothetical protein
VLKALPWIGFVGGIVLAVLTANMTPTKANWLLVLAWAIFVGSFLILPTISKLPLSKRVALTAAFGVVCALGVHVLWQPNRPPISLTLRGLFAAPDWQSTSGFWILGAKGDSKLLVNLAAYGVIVNDSPESLRADELSIQVKNKMEDWVTMVRLETEGLKVYYAQTPDLHKAAGIDASPFVDRLLTKSALKPHGDVEGWLLMNYPPYWRPEQPLTFRVTFTNVRGTSHMSNESRLGKPPDTGVITLFRVTRSTPTLKDLRPLRIERIDRI